MNEQIFEFDKFLDILEIKVINFKKFNKEEFKHELRMLIEKIDDVFALDNEIIRVAFRRV